MAKKVPILLRFTARHRRESRAGDSAVASQLTRLFEPMRREDDFDLEVVGRIPDAVAGAYYRNGPNTQFDPEGPYFPFLADGMIHAFFLEPDKAAAAHVIVTAGSVRQNGMPRTRRDGCSFTALASRRILARPTSIRARPISTSSTMQANCWRCPSTASRLSSIRDVSKAAPS